MTEQNEQTPDFTVQNEGSIFLLTPKTEAAQQFVDTHIDPEAQTFCDAIVVEHRFIGAIVEGIAQHGLTVGDA